MSKSPNSSNSPKSQVLRSLNLKALLIVVFILLIVGMGIAQASRPYPAIAATPVSTSVVLPGQFSVTFPVQGESAVGTVKFGVISASAVQTPVPIASVAKVMTAYLVLKAYPLKTGQDGPTLTMTVQDVTDYQNDLKDGDSVLKVTQGENLTEKQLLEGLLLPSGDNVATTLGRWVSGTDAAFVAQMNETAKSLGMTSTHYEDSSGVSPATTSNAVDQIKMAQAAMQDPTFREIVAMPQVTLPVAGTVYNVNGMLGKHGVVGIKTGSTLAAGGCFISATPVGVGNEADYIIAAVLGQKTVQSLKSALDSNVNIIDQVRSEFKMYPLTQPATGFGQITSAWHAGSDLKATQPVQIFGYPGLKVSLSVKDLQATLPLSSGIKAATLKVQAGQEIQNVPLQSDQEIKAPGLLWRLFRF